MLFNKYKKILSIVMIIFIFSFPLMHVRQTQAAWPLIAKIGLAAIATAGGIHFATEDAADSWTAHTLANAPEQIKHDIQQWTAERVVIGALTWEYLKASILGTEGSYQIEYESELGTGFIDGDEITFYDDYCTNLSITANNITAWSIDGANAKIFIAYKNQNGTWVNTGEIIQAVGNSHYDGRTIFSLQLKTPNGTTTIREVFQPDYHVPYTLSVSISDSTGVARVELDGVVDYVQLSTSEYSGTYVGKALLANGEGTYYAASITDDVLMENEDFSRDASRIEALEGEIWDLKNKILDLSGAGITDMAGAISADPNELNEESVPVVYVPPIGEENITNTVAQWLQKIVLDIGNLNTSIRSIPASIAKAITDAFVPSANYFPNWFNQLQGAICLPSFDDIFDFNYIEKDISWMVTIGGYSILPEVTFQLIPDLILDQRNWIRTITGAWIVFVTGIFAVRKVSRLINS